MLAGTAGLIKAFWNVEGFYILHTFIIGFGMAWIIKGIIGREFFIGSKRYFVIRNNKIVIKNPHQSERIYPADAIKGIKVAHTGIDINMDDYVKSFDLKWLSYQEFQELKGGLRIFCNRNKIELDQEPNL